MQTRELMTGQTLYFYAGAGTGVVMLEGSMRVTLGNMQMDGYGWQEQITLTGSGEWMAPRSGWIRIEAQRPARLHITEPQPLQWRARVMKALKLFSGQLRRAQ